MSGEDVKAGALALEVEYELDALAVKAARLTEAMRGLTRERDEARAEVERLRESLEWSEACRKARLSMAETCLNGRAAGKSPCGACSICCGDFKAEVEHLQRGIKRYRQLAPRHRSYLAWGAKEGEAVSQWEREDQKRRESGAMREERER